VEQKQPPFRMGSVALIGRPNVGKSTLLNHLLDFKLSITSPKPQTSRHRLRGILTKNNYQMVFFDTPGLMSKARDSLDRRMRTHARDAVEEADLVLLIVEPFPPGAVEEECIQSLKESEKTAILAINKIDRIKKEVLLPVIEKYNDRFPFIHSVPVSARTSEGLQLLETLIADCLPEGKRMYPIDEVTDRSERFLAGELVRQQLYYLYGQEIPYDTGVWVESFRDPRTDFQTKTVIEATIFVEKISQKQILIGSNGDALKKVGVQAREAIEKLLQRPVFLDLWVQVQPNWRTDQKVLEELGY
jgi:GTP-binding protein Era